MGRQEAEAGRGRGKPFYKGDSILNLNYIYCPLITCPLLPASAAAAPQPAVFGCAAASAARPASSTSRAGDRRGCLPRPELGVNRKKSGAKQKSASECPKLMEVRT